jgi:hypothetical protein
MDINTMIEERLTQCCVHVATVNETTAAHQCAPFCACRRGRRWRARASRPRPVPPWRMGAGDFP